MYGNIKGIYAKYIIIMLATTAVLFSFSSLVYHYLLKPSYIEYIHYFYLLCISSLIWSVSNIFLQPIIFNKQKRIIFRLSVLCILFAFTINYCTSQFLTINWLCAGQIVTNAFVLCVILYFNKKINCFA